MDDDQKKHHIINRPDFYMLHSYEEFAKYYWYRKELAQICKTLHLEHTGTKQALNENIKAYFNGMPVKNKKLSVPRRDKKLLSLHDSLLECGFSFNAKFRAFFAEQTGKKNFKFTADMATTWRKVKQDGDKNFTLQDLLDVYYNKSNYAKYDDCCCQWNRFVKDFCADKNNERIHNKLKAASILWHIVKNSDQPKVYTQHLAEKHKHLIINL